MTGYESLITIHNPKRRYQMLAWKNERHVVQKKRMCQRSSETKGTPRSVNALLLLAKPELPF